MRKTFYCLVLALPILILCGPSKVHSQNGASFFTEAEFVSTSPDSSGEFEQFLVEKALEIIGYAEIETGMPFARVFFANGQREDVSWYAFMTEADGVVQFLSMSPAATRLSKSTVSIETDLKFSSKDEYVFPLAVLFDREASKVNFAWTMSGKSIADGGQAVGTIRREELGPGSEMPAFAVRSMENETIALEDYAGKTLVINWWSTTCGPCIKEMPELNELAQKYEGDDSVEFLAIAWDKAKDVERMLARRPFIYRQSLYGIDTFDLFGNAFPIHVVVDKDGQIAFFRAGYNPRINSQLEAAIEELREG